MRILFADTFDPTGVERLATEGHECVVEPTLGGRELVDAVAGFDVLVVRSTPVTADVVAAADRLQLVVRAGAGTNTIDCDAAADRAVVVSNVPGRNAVAVAELTMGLLLAVDRHIVDATADARAGRWDKARYSRARGLAGRAMGIVGLGQIGLAVAERAQAFGLTLVALDRSGRTAATRQRIDDLDIELVTDLDRLFDRADIVSLHVPAAADTEGLVDDRLLRRLEDDAVLLNTSRGSAVDEAALLTALDRGLHAGLDVFADEPAESGAFASALARHPHVVATHHIGASTAQAQAAIAAGTVEVIEAFAAGRNDNSVNLETHALGACTLVVRHLDRVGVLAQVLAVLRANGNNVRQMTNQVFQGGHAAVATMRVEGHPGDAVAEQLQAIDEVIGVVIRPDPEP